MHWYSNPAIVVAVFGILVAVIIFGSPRSPRVIEPVNPDDPDKLPDGIKRTVLVAGGGLAGLSTALELAERGYDVTIREASDVIGGRLFAKPVEVLNRTFYLEHGFHGWFYNYYQFKDIRKRLDIDHNFKPWGPVHMIFRDHKPEILYSEGPYPLNLLAIVYRSLNINFWQALTTVLAIPDLFWFNYDEVYERHDNISLAEWAQIYHVNTNFYDIIMQPSLSVTMNERETLSAAEMLMYMQIYFLNNPKADYREVTTVDHFTGILEPWVKKLKSFGVIIELNSTVEGFVFDNKTGNIISADDKNYDYFVLATDFGGVRDIMKSSANRYVNNALVHNNIQRFMGGIDGLAIAPPYKVIRIWFDKQIPNAPDILQCPEHYPINLIAQYHLLERESAIWANKTGGSIMEFHLYTWKYGPVSDSEVWGIISPTAMEIFPEIIEKNFKILAVNVFSYENFPSFQAGSNRHRPMSHFAKSCGISNLMLAGDWLRTSYPSALMERAVSTGREAANHILLSDHVKQVPLLVASSLGPGILSAWW
ncbi:carotenoid phi-ring synthase-like [Saccoglossus kowalevskii]|uniref:15-cis-phytoene desaturase, chloroplastic/chromoplastic-like n=1 Tax=Saccoglossus kowalevskii TaxID=10224 RepID=A0ABM0MJD8_SACKO|nr:PREDICTED: 15-cis-phytoene desaturase, chloroplastic/chromoplastic-like [Saccoglossus kowalevskii]